MHETKSDEQGDARRQNDVLTTSNTVSGFRKDDEKSICRALIEQLSLLHSLSNKSKMPLTHSELQRN